MIADPAGSLCSRQMPHRPRSGQPARGSSMDAGYDAHVRSIVRPYVVTGGRTRATVDLALETLVETTQHGHAMRSAVHLKPEQRLTLELCDQRLHSVAEISAHVRLPFWSRPSRRGRYGPSASRHGSRPIHCHRTAGDTRNGTRSQRPPKAVTAGILRYPQPTEPSCPPQQPPDGAASKPTYGPAARRSENVYLDSSPELRGTPHKFRDEERLTVAARRHSTHARVIHRL